MKRNLLILALLLTSYVSRSQQAIIIPRDTLLKSVIELKRDTTVYANGKYMNGSYSGTGMFVITHSNHIYIVTAAHVAKDMDSKAYVIMEGQNNSPIKLSIKSLTSSKLTTWVYHKRADIAILELHPDQSIINLLQRKFISTDNISHDSVTAVSRDIQLTVMGFPLALGADGRFSPLTYRTYASSGFLTYPRADTHMPSEFVMLENPSVGGYSGGPVFDVSITVINGMTATGNGTVCYGFIHGTLADETGGKLAAVTPSYFLFDLIK